MNEAAEITVRRLHLGAGAAGLRPRVEDALRISSKPPALLNRHVLLRRLRLRAAPGASAQALAAQLERAWQELAARAEALEQASDTAEAVWAPSVAAAQQALLRRWLRDEPCEAWFWQRIAPPAAGLAWPERALAMMRMPLDDGVMAPGMTQARRHARHVRGLLALIAEHGAAHEFVAAMAEADAQALVQMMEADEAARPHRPAHADHTATTPSTARTQLLQHMRAMPEAETAPQLAPAARSSSFLNTRVESAASSPETSPAAAPPRPPVTTAQAIASHAVQAAEAARELDHGFTSPWSGLWLLLPMLLRHGLADADDPLAAWAGALAAACRSLRIPSDDALHTALSALELPQGDDEHWLRIARLGAVHDARLPLLRIARRPGRAWVSPERIDVEFPMRSLDLRIRRAGFDIDPGFVPWLGRIVHFHYPS